MNKYIQGVYWYNRSYGKAIRIKIAKPIKWTLKGVIISLGVLIPVIIPLPLCVLIAAKIKDQIVYRY